MTLSYQIPKGLHISGRVAPEETNCMTGLAAIFTELGLTQYLDAFVEQGFDTWETILDITESDFDALGVKLGHRRKLQRRIANFRGVALDRSLDSPKRPAASIEDNSNEVTGRSRSEAKEPQPATGKRKYRRHPKPDENAPERPPSAYVVFSNKMREELKGRNLSFTEIAKLVGENWQNLSVEGKEPYESQAFSAKEKYNAALSEYKKTSMYKRYSDYLAEFKAKHSNQPSGTAKTSGDLAPLPHSMLIDSATELVKRPKLDERSSTGSSENASSGTEPHIHDANHLRTASTPVWVASAQQGDSGHHSLPNMPGLVISHGRSNDQAPSSNHGSPAAMSGVLLPGYRDLVIGAAQQQALAWREHGRDTMPHILGQVNASRRSSGPTHSQSPLDSPMHSHLPTTQTSSRRGPAFTPPPLLTTESTVTSTGSAPSQPSGYYGPRTPIEPASDRPSERQLPLPLYPLKPIGQQEHFSIGRPPSLSPQTPLDTSYNSPTNIVAMDYSSLPPRRNYVPPLQHTPLPGLAQMPLAGGNTHRPRPAYIHEEPLDPVSALLKAGEIVDSGSRNRTLQ